MLDDPDYKEVKQKRSPIPKVYSSDSSSDSSSGIQIVTKPKMLKRPKRPVRGRLMKSSSVDKVNFTKCSILALCYVLWIT